MNSIDAGLRIGADGKVATTIANLVANRINIKKNVRYSYRDRPWMIPIFNDQSKNVFFKFARQISKSTTLSARSLIHTEIYNPYTVMYISPTFKQTSVFSHERLGPTIKDSPSIQVRMDSESLDNVLEKSFVDGSAIYLLYAKDNADRCRGYTADEILYDEIQDMNLKAIEAVVGESLFTSIWKRRAYSGTPKSFANPVQALWEDTDQCELMVRCRRHGALPYHQALTMRNLGLRGPICNRCGHKLNTMDSVWVSTNSSDSHGKKPTIRGYHLPQIVFPTDETILADGKPGFLAWSELLRDIDRNDEATTLNEKFGESADSAQIPVSQEKLMSICTSDRPMAMEYMPHWEGSYTFAGVDWGAGIDSATAFVIGQFDPRNPAKFKILYCRRFHKKEANPEFCVPEIMRLCEKFRVKRLHADWGSGLGQNSKILANMGDDFITTNYWSSSISGKNMTFDNNLNRFVLNRSVTISRFFEALNSNGFAVDFSWGEWKTYAEDIMNVRKEERKNGDPFYVHVNGRMDDFMHATVYCWLIASWIKYSEDYVDRLKSNAGAGFGSMKVHDPTLKW